MKKLLLKKDKETQDKLTPKQELFCRYYTTEGETFSNATTSYALAYGYDFASLSDERDLDENDKEILGTSKREKAEHVCQVAGSQNLFKFVIIDRVRELMAEKLDNDELFDARLTSIAIKGNASDSLNAIKHRNDLKQRITKKLSITTIERPFAHVSDEELERMSAE